MSILNLNSATPTKIRAMQANLLKKENFLSLANSESVNEVIHKLDEFKSYHSIFSSLDIDNLKRRDLERILYVKLLADYGQLYKFVNGSYRSFLKLYFIHFEVTMLKRVLRDVIAHKPVSSIDVIFKPYFDKYSKVDFDTVCETTDFKSFTEALKGTIYYEALSKLDENSTLFDFELCMDLIYFKSIWKQKNKFLSKQDVEALNTIIGSRCDLLNLQWIWRCKRYYKLDAVTTYSLLVPIYRKLSEKDIKAMVEAANLDEVMSAFDETYYGKVRKLHFENINTIETLSDKILYYTFTQTAKNNPNSVVILYSYLFRREFEIEALIHIIESVNYGVPADQNIDPTVQ